MDSQEAKDVEEAIKHLEDILYVLRSNYKYRTSYAIELLINGYRTLEKHIGFYEKNGSYKARIIELEENLDNSRKANELLNKTNDELRLEIRTTYSKVVNDIISKFNLGDDYISKSKVDEKIEELDNMIKEINERKTSKVHSRRDCSF